MLGTTGVRKKESAWPPYVADLGEDWWARGLRAVALRGTGFDPLLNHRDLGIGEAAFQRLAKSVDAIVHNVAKGKRVTVVGFGTFLPRQRKARSGRNPTNGKEIKIHSKTIPAFAAGQGFKEAVDKN